MRDNLYRNIPALLKQQPNWVVWGVPGAVPKAPYNPESLLKLQTVPAKSGVSDTWGSYENAIKCVEMGLAVESVMSLTDEESMAWT